MIPAFSWAAWNAASASEVNGLTILGPAKPSVSIPSASPSTLSSCPLSCPDVRLTSTFKESWTVIDFDEVAGGHSNSSFRVNLLSVGVAIGNRE